MGADFIQHAIVTLAAIAAAWVVVRRVFTVVKPSAAAPRSARPALRSRSACGTPPQAQKNAQPVSSEAKPLTLIR